MTRQNDISKNDAPQNVTEHNKFIRMTLASRQMPLGKMSLIGMTLSKINSPEYDSTERH
jgi:hypothetical protein